MKKARRIIISALTAMMMTVQLCPPVSAAETVTYKKYSWDIYTKQLVETTETTSNYTVVTGELAKNNPNGLPGGTYVVNSDTTIEDYVYVQKDKTVNLIVKDGVTLTCKKGIGCGYNKKNEYAALNIYGTGKIVTTGKENAAGIGGDNDETNGYITIHGTTVEATGGKHAAGIGGGEGGKDPDASSPTISIYGGKITAAGGIDGAGIGGGDEQPGAITYIYGGEITASSKKHGAGIGGGDEEGTYGVWIYGGTVTATGGNHGAGIGAGEEGGNLRKREDGGGINILGGTVKATGGSGGAGIGGGYDEDMSGTINISGDDTKITANGGYGSAGIGAGKGDSSDWCVPEGDMKGTITIECGEQSEIKVTGGGKSGTHGGGAGIGAGFAGNMTGKVYIKGGNIEITSGDMAAGIGGGRENGKYGGEGGDVYIGGGNITINTINSFWYYEEKSHAIGCGVEDAKDGSIYFKADKNATEPSYMRVEYMPYDKDEFKTASASDRSKKCHTRSTLRITECDHTGGLNSTVTPTQHVIKCKYCGWKEQGEHDGLTCHCGYVSSEWEYYREITLKMKMGSVAGAIVPMASSCYEKINTVFEIPECEYKPTDQRFTGWVLNDDTTDLKQPGETITITDNITLDAQYADLYTVGYNGSTTSDNWITISSGTADEDDEITVTGILVPGYKLKSVTVRADDADGDVLIEKEIEGGKNTFTFPMPAQNVYVDREFEVITYNVIISESENGKVTSDKTTADEGDTVTLSAEPVDNSYYLSKISCRTVSGTEVELEGSGLTYTFKMPAESVTVSADFEENDHPENYISGASLTLKGDIGVNIYLRLSTYLSSRAYVTVQGPNDTTPEKLFLYELPTVDKYGYKITRQLSAQQMGTSVVIHLFNADDEEQPLVNLYNLKDQYNNGFSYSPTRYFATVKNGSTADYPQKLKDLCTAMERYGEYARRHFKENYPTVCDLTDEDKAEVEAVTAAEIDNPYSPTQLPDGVTFAGATLTLKSETTLSFYFTGDLENPGFFCSTEVSENADWNGKKFFKVETVKAKSEEYEYTIARVRGINAKLLGNTFQLTVKGNYSVNYSPMTYCYNVLNDNSGTYEDDLKNVCKALYLYWQASAAYFS